MTHPAPRVTSAGPQDLPACAATLAEAFAENSEFRWMVPDDDARATLLPVFFGSSLRHTAATGSVLITRSAAADPENAGAEGAGAEGTGTAADTDDAGAITGVSAWSPPGTWRPAWWRELLNAPRMLFAASAPQLRRFAQRGAMVEKAMRAAHPESPHWYLAGIGTAPDAAGTGVGTAMMRAGMDRAAAQGLPVYLECVRELVPYDERFGFTVVHDIPVGEGCPEQVGMWWEPSH